MLTSRYGGYEHDRAEKIGNRLSTIVCVVEVFVNNQLQLLRRKTCLCWRAWLSTGKYRAEFHGVDRIVAHERGAGIGRAMRLHCRAQMDSDAAPSATREIGTRA